MFLIKSSINLSPRPPPPPLPDAQPRRRHLSTTSSRCLLLLFFSSKPGTCRISRSTASARKTDGPVPLELHCIRILGPLNLVQGVHLQVQHPRSVPGSRRPRPSPTQARSRESTRALHGCYAIGLWRGKMLCVKVQEEARARSGCQECSHHFFEAPEVLDV